MHVLFEGREVSGENIVNSMRCAMDNSCPISSTFVGELEASHATEGSRD